MVVGGLTGGDRLDTVELVSLDPQNHPVPECLKSLNPFPTRDFLAFGAELQGGTIFTYFAICDNIPLIRFTCGMWRT